MGGQHEGHQHDHGTDELVLHVEGMTCNGCASKVSRSLSALSNIVDVHVDLGKKEVHIQGAGESGLDAHEFVDAVNAAGYAAKIKSANTTTGILARWSTTVLVGASLTAVMMVGDWALGWQETSYGPWLLLALASIIQLYCGNAFLKGAINQAKQGKSDMDTLVALGSWTAYLYSLWSFFSQNNHHLYFVEAGSIISLVSLGHFLEAKISERAESSLKKLMNLQTNEVILLAKDGSQSVVRSSQLKIGDHIILKSGDRIPVDAKVLQGGSSLDESAISGESHPIDKDIGDKLISGTLVLDGQITAEVSAVGRNTALAQIIETVKRAQNSRAAIQNIADKVSSIFVPAVVLIAVSAFALWYYAPDTMAHFASGLESTLWTRHIDPSRLSQAILCAVGVLIIACPCAMGLATPAALMAGSNRAAKSGVLIRDASAIEKSAIITHVFFDKTGTLTMGELEVVEVLKTPAFKDTDLAIALALASQSKHPISKAIARHLKTNATVAALASFKEERGKGLSATADGHSYRLGSLPWQRDVIKLKSDLFGKLETSTASLNVLSRDNEVLAIFLLKDQIKTDSAKLISDLRAKGIQVGIISGDREAVVLELAKQLGLDEENVHAEVAPERKAQVIEAHQLKGHAVAFVGDGINDAPALKMATLGIAVSSASDIAKDSADLILIKNDIKQIPWALEISARTLSTIKQNLFWAFCYNVLAIPLAFSGFVSPIICAAAMGLSDVFVILNSLRLAFYHSAQEKEVV